jgi:hypothetical protein
LRGREQGHERAIAIDEQTRRLAVLAGQRIAQPAEGAAIQIDAVTDLAAAGCREIAEHGVFSLIDRPLGSVNPPRRQHGACLDNAGCDSDVNVADSQANSLISLARDYRQID